MIVEALDDAAGHGAQIVNMSFTGPKDPVVGRGIAAVAVRGILMVAAVGNAGAKARRALTLLKEIRFQNLKKIAARLERMAGLARPNFCGSGNPSP